MTLLALESSCDETSAAVVRDGRVLSSAVSSQIKLHAEYGGVVPELAAREHLRNLIPVVQIALHEAGVQPGQLDAVAATQGPGLPMALLIGFKAAQAIAFALRKPFMGINHHEAHLYSPWISTSNVLPASCRQNNLVCQQDAGSTLGFADFGSFQPNVSLIVSGGHTMLVRVESELKHRVLGSTVDDAAGECFDKTGKLMGLPYPAGPEIDRLAEQGNPKAYDFPRPLLHDASDDFSFSGLKTSVLYFLRKNPHHRVEDVCASFQEAAVDVLVGKVVRAAVELRVNTVSASGGVSINRRFREKLGAECARRRLQLLLAPANLCTDNAAMIAGLAFHKLQSGGQSDFSLEVAPSIGLGVGDL